MAKVKWLDRRIARPGPYLALVLSQEEFNAAMRHCGLPTGAPYVSPEASATTHLSRGKTGDVMAVVALGDTSERNPIEVAGLLVHEAVHVWQEYCESIGEANPGHEQEAYAVQAIAQELMAEYARRMEL